MLLCQTFHGKQKKLHTHIVFFLSGERPFPKEMHNNDINFGTRRNSMFVFSRQSCFCMKIFPSTTCWLTETSSCMHNLDAQRVNEQEQRLIPGSKIRKQNNWFANISYQLIRNVKNWSRKIVPKRASWAHLFLLNLLTLSNLTVYLSIFLSICSVILMHICRSLCISI